MNIYINRFLSYFIILVAEIIHATVDVIIYMLLCNDTIM